MKASYEETRLTYTLGTYRRGQECRTEPLPAVETVAYCIVKRCGRVAFEAVRDFPAKA